MIKAAPQLLAVLENTTMFDSAASLTRAVSQKMRLPWFVSVTPEYYDDEADTGFGWEGWAIDEGDAVRQALESCYAVNDREPEGRKYDVDVDHAIVHVAEIDFRRFAGPLLHWAGQMGGWDTPLWRMLEEAVREAKLEVAPLESSHPSG